MIKTFLKSLILWFIGRYEWQAGSRLPGQKAHWAEQKFAKKSEARAYARSMAWAAEKPVIKRRWLGISAAPLPMWLRADTF